MLPACCGTLHGLASWTQSCKAPSLTLKRASARWFVAQALVVVPVLALELELALVPTTLAASSSLKTSSTCGAMPPVATEGVQM